jgi:hypothetical protein
MGSNSWWSGPIVLIALRLLYLEAAFARAEARGDAFVFRAGRGVSVLFLTTVLVSVVAVVTIAAGQEDLWLITIPTVFLMLAAFSWPAAIVVAQGGITQKLWWGRTIRLAWPDVTGIEKRAGGELNVFDRSGEIIAFSRYHVDPRRFEAEVLKRAKLDNVIDASRPPTMRL